MTMVKIRKHYQITVPKKIGQAAGLEVGDYLEVELHEGGIFLKPMKAVFIEKSQLTEAEVLKRVEKGEITSSRGAELLSMSYQDFIELMDKAGVPVWNYTSEEAKLADQHAERLFSQNS